MESVNNFDEKLYISSFYGDLEGVVAALAQGGRVSVRNFQGATPLLAAAQSGHTDICGLLLEHGSDVNEVHLKTKRTALHLAATYGQEPVVEALLSWRAIVDPRALGGVTPLYFACQNGHLACVLALLKAGASVSVPTDVGNLPIHIAAQQNRVEIVRTLLDYGCSPDLMEPETKATALHYAATSGHEAVVEALLSWGAIVDPQNQRGATPLHLACGDGHLACVLALLKAGASVSVSDNFGILPIHMAAAHNGVEIVRALLDYGCSPDMLFSQNNKTPLMSAALGGADETVAFLLSKGADPDLMDNNGYTALVAAIQFERLSTIDLLAPVTQKGLGRALQCLAISQTELTPAIKKLLERASSDKDALIKGVAMAARMGATSLLKILTNGWNKDTLSQSDANDLLLDALKSDNAETVQVILAFVSDVSPDNIALALKRGRADVVKLFDLGLRDTASATYPLLSPTCGLTGCGVKVGKGGLCTGCRSVNYCSKEHQRRDWPSHKLKCRPLKTLITDHGVYSEMF